MRCALAALDSLADATPLLDRTPESTAQMAQTDAAAEERSGRLGRLVGLPRRFARAWREDGWRGLPRRFWQFVVAISFSSLTRRIVVLNVVGLLALVVGILYLSQFRAGLIEARVQSLLVQGEIIANAIAASGTADSYNTFNDRESLELQLGENFGAIEENLLASSSPSIRSGCACAAAADLADQDPRPHLRPQRLHADRQPQPLPAGRGAALRSAAAGRRAPRMSSQRPLDGLPDLVRTRRPAALPRTALR